VLDAPIDDTGPHTLFWRTDKTWGSNKLSIFVCMLWWNVRERADVGKPRQEATTQG
jgi:hypothetical protein